jgi:plasmid stability protein
MAAVSVRHLDDKVRDRLRVRAAQHVTRWRRRSARS